MCQFLLLSVQEIIFIAPIPGGCAADNNEDPILKVSDGPDIITMKAEPPSLNNHVCNVTGGEAKIEIYHKYLKSQDFDTLLYFDGILKMLDVDSIKENGRLVATVQDYSGIEKFFSSYIGTGEVFAVVVYNNETESAYVPGVSYGEDVNYLIEKEENGKCLYCVAISRLQPRLPTGVYFVVYYSTFLISFSN